MSRSSLTGMNGPAFPKCTWYRSSLNRCGNKRVPNFLPRDTIAKSIELLPRPWNLPYSTNGVAVLVSGKSVEKCALFFCVGNVNFEVVFGPAPRQRDLEQALLASFQFRSPKRSSSLLIPAALPRPFFPNSSAHERNDPLFQ